MPISMSFELSKEDHSKLLEDAKSELRDGITSEAVDKYMRENQDISMVSVVSNFGVYPRYEALKHKTVNELTNNEKLICALNWLMFEKLL